MAWLAEACWVYQPRCVLLLYLEVQLERRQGGLHQLPLCTLLCPPHNGDVSERRPRPSLLGACSEQSLQHNDSGKAWAQEPCSSTLLQELILQQHFSGSFQGSMNLDKMFFYWKSVLFFLIYFWHLPWSNRQVRGNFPSLETDLSLTELH